MLQVLLHEHRLDELDVPFLEHRTSVPYLTGPNGWYLREPASRKPLVWDLKNGGAVPHDTPGIDPALVGSFKVEAVEVGVDGELIEHAQAQGQPAHVRLIQHVAARTPPTRSRALRAANRLPCNAARGRASARRGLGEVHATPPIRRVTRARRSKRRWR